MKKFKNLMLMLALALFFVGAMGITKASAATTVAPDYLNEYITISEAGAQVYYQVVKAEEPGVLKPANWIKAAAKGDVYYIDFSAVANSKDGYIAWTTNPAASAATDYSVETINAEVKSLKVNLNYAKETLAKENIDEIISKVNVKPIEGDEKKDIVPANYVFQWKRGANGTWEKENTFTQLDWDMVKASNATLYISVIGGTGDSAVDADSAAYAYRPSKEVKVKIPKAAKAPSVKIDYVKGTVALKNGMQVRVIDSEGKPGDWITVSPYDKDEVNNSQKFDAEATKVTKTKVSGVTIAELLTELLVSAKNEEITVEVRTAATEKKFPSAIGSLTFTTPNSFAACNDGVVINYVKADNNAKVKAEFTIDFTEILNGVTENEYDAYEYILVDAADAEKQVDFMKQKWTKVPANGKLDLKGKIEAKTKYAATTEEGTVEFDYTAIKAILVRKMGNKEYMDGETKVPATFPSIYAAPTVTIKQAYAITVAEAENVTVTCKVGENEVKNAVAGDTVKVTCVAAEGYENPVVTVKKGSDAVEYADGSFTMPAGNVTITVEVSEKQEAGGETEGNETT